MSEPTLHTFSGWPWPLEPVQGWFEDLWDTVYGWFKSVAKWVWDALPEPLKKFIDFLKDLTRGLWDRIIAFFKDPVGALKGIFDGIIVYVSGGLEWLQAAIAGIAEQVWKVLPDPLKNFITFLKDLTKAVWDSIIAFFKDPVGTLKGIVTGVVTFLQEVGSWIISQVWGWIKGGLDWLTDVFKWLHVALNDAADWIVRNIGPAIDWAVKAINDYTFKQLMPLQGAAAGLFDIFKNFGTNVDPVGVADMITEQINQYKGDYERLYASKSPVTPEEAATMALAWEGIANIAYTSLANVMVAVEALSLGQIDVTLTQYFNVPIVRNFFETAIRIRETIDQASLLIPVRQYYLSKFTPMIPSKDDLVLMVVREAFLPEMVVEAPKAFADSMLLAGFSKIWSDRYWTAHFIPIALRQAYENLWRGYWDKDRFMFALHIADIHPMWREDIYNVAFSPPSIREMGYGFDVGAYSLEDIIKYRRWGGLAEEDAKKAAVAMVAYRTEAEREALRREAMADYVAGIDDETQLRANLTAIGGRPEIIELWVARAKFRRDRDIILDLVKISVDQYVKGAINRSTLDQDLITLGIEADRRAVIISDAETRRLRYVREEEKEQKKRIPVARVRTARDLGLIGNEEYVTRLVDHDYTLEDAILDLAIELTPRPVTIEEIERRRRTIISRRNRAERRYERILARIQDQISLTAAQLEDLKLTMDESLDVIDVQIAIIDAELPTASPERAVELTKHRLVLVQRRELTVARFEARIRKLTEQHKALIELQALYVRQRDEELAEYDMELKVLEVAS